MVMIVIRYKIIWPKIRIHASKLLALVFLDVLTLVTYCTLSNAQIRRLVWSLVFELDFWSLLGKTLYSQSKKHDQVYGPHISVSNSDTTRQYTLLTLIKHALTPFPFFLLLPLSQLFCLFWGFQLIKGDIFPYTLCILTSHFIFEKEREHQDYIVSFFILLFIWKGNGKRVNSLTSAL